MSLDSYDIVELGHFTVAEMISIEEMIQTGEYDGHLHDFGPICKHFSITSRGSRKLYLAHFKQYMTSEQVTAMVAQMPNKELAKIEYLLVIGAHPKHKDLQREFPIICLGSYAVLDTCPAFVCLDSWYDERLLYLAEDDIGCWPDYSRILLVDGESSNT